MLARIKSEPAVIYSLIGAALTVAISFGLHLTDGQLRAITALAMIVVGVATRSQVTPVIKTPDPAPVAAPEPAPAPVVETPAPAATEPPAAV